MGNRLKAARSPYLLAHAEDPVDWYPFGEEAFRKAQQLQPRNISFALNAAQSLLRVAAEGNNAELFAEAREGLRRIAGIPRDDQRYERYVKLRELAEKG